MILVWACAAAPALADHVTTIDGPFGATNDTTPEFWFSSEPAGATFECRVDFGPIGPCESSPYTTAELESGPHTIEVRAIHAGSAPATRTFTVDTTPPETTIDAGPSDPTNDATPTFTFSSNELGATFDCQLDGGAFTPCASPYATAELPAGAHTFAIRAEDTAGNFDPSPAIHSFTVDTTAPETTITAGPAGSTSDPTATVTFSSDDSGSSFECQVDAGEFAPCTSPFVTQSLANGLHTITVRALDAAGNTDPTPATRSFTVALVSGSTGNPGGGAPAPTVQARVLRRLTLAPSKRRVAHGSALRLRGSLKSNAGRRSCQSRQKIALQRRKSSGGRFQTFEVAVTTTSGSFKAATRPSRTYLYRARVSQTVRCMGATSKAAWVVVRKRAKAGSNRA